jgi:DNA-binding transcriptional LysR family regulator
VAGHAPLNVPRLRILYELTRRGSVTAVADALVMTPSAVSQQLATLERETGVKLVERAGRGVAPTPAGRALAEHAERVLAALDAAQAAVEAVAQRPEGRVRVAAFPSVVLRLLAPAIGSLRRSHPQLTVEVEDLEGVAGVDAVRLRRVDVAIVDDEGWEAGARLGAVAVDELFDDPLVVVLPPGHRLAEHAEVRWSDLAHEAFVVEHGGSLFAQTVAGHCRRAGFEPRVHARVHDLSAQCALVAAAGCVCVLPRLATDGRSLPVRPLVPAVQRRLLAVTRTDDRDLPGVRALLEAIEAVAAGLRPPASAARSGDGA